MKQGMKKTVLVLLALSLAFGSISFAAAEPEEKPFTHVVLGDSTHIGYALKEYEIPYFGGGSYTANDCSGFNCLVKGSIPYLVDDYLKTKYPSVKTYQYGIAGTRLYEMRYFLDNDYPSDTYFYSFERMNYANMLRTTDPSKDSLSSDELTAYFRELYQSAVREADLVTIAVGGNDFFSWINLALRGGDPALEQYLRSLRYDSRANGVRQELYDRFADAMPGMLPAELENVLAGAVAAYLDATVGVDQLVACIRDLNPDTRIIVASVNNFLSDFSMTLEDGTVLPLPLIGNILCGMANAYRRTLSPYAGEYYFADLSTVSVTTIADEMMRPVSEYTEDADVLMHSLLSQMGVSLDNVSFTDAAERAATMFREKDVIQNAIMDFKTGAILRNELAIRYLETGCDLSADEYEDVATYVASVMRLAGASACHPSTAGYLAELPVFTAAIDTDKTPRAYNAAATVTQLHSYEDTAKEITKTVVKTVSEAIRSGIRSAISKIAERRNAWK